MSGSLVPEKNLACISSSAPFATRSHSLPGLARLSARFADVDLRFWPLDQLGGYV
jgi:hypothetical protein